MVMSLDEAFGNDIHFGLIKVCGSVAPENPQLNPKNIAAKTMALYEQEKGSWELMTFVREELN